MSRTEAIRAFEEAVKNLRAPWPYASLPVNPAEIRFVIGDGITWPGTGEKRRYITPQHCFYYADLPNGSRVRVGQGYWKTLAIRAKMNSAEAARATMFITGLQEYLNRMSAFVLDLPWQKNAVEEIKARVTALELVGTFKAAMKPPELYFAVLLWYLQYAAQVLVMNFVRSGDRVRLWPGAEIAFAEGQWPQLRLYYPRCYPPTAWVSVSLAVESQAGIEALAGHHYLWAPVGLARAIRVCEEIIGKYP